MYFFLFYTIVYCVVNEPDFESDGVQFNNPGFQTDTPTVYEGESEAAVQADTDFSSFSTIFNVMSGISTNNVRIGVPSLWTWLFHFIFFWLPFAIFAIAFYFSLPFAH